MRYFLAVGPPRTYASLFDVLGVSQTEYWDRPFGSPAELQAAIAAGRRVWVPAFLRDEIDRANAAGVAHIETVAEGDSLLLITHITGSAPP